MRQQWNDRFWERKFFTYNMIRFRSAMKPTFLIMNDSENQISLPKILVSLPI